MGGRAGPRQTFIFPYVLEGECEAGVFSLDNADLAKGAFAHDSQQAKVVEVDLVGEDDGLAVALTHGGFRVAASAGQRGCGEAWAMSGRVKWQAGGLGGDR